jgi:hypothetical protein
MPRQKEDNSVKLGNMLRNYVGVQNQEIRRLRGDLTAYRQESQTNMRQRVMYPRALVDVGTQTDETPFTEEVKEDIADAAIPASEPPYLPATTLVRSRTAAIPASAPPYLPATTLVRSKTAEELDEIRPRPPAIPFGAPPMTAPITQAIRVASAQLPVLAEPFSQEQADMEVIERQRAIQEKIEADPNFGRPLPLYSPQPSEEAAEEPPTPPPSPPPITAAEEPAEKQEEEIRGASGGGRGGARRGAGQPSKGLAPRGELERRLRASGKVTKQEIQDAINDDEGATKGLRKLAEEYAINIRKTGSTSGQ